VQQFENFNLSIHKLQRSTYEDNVGCKKQESQLPQRNSASAAHVYLGWLTDRAMHRTPQNRRGCIICLTFKCYDSRSTGRKRILTSRSRLTSRSFKVIHFAISYWPTSLESVAYRHMILLTLSLKIPKQ